MKNGDEQVQVSCRQPVNLYALVPDYCWKLFDRPLCPKVLGRLSPPPPHLNSPPGTPGECSRLLGYRVLDINYILPHFEFDFIPVGGDGTTGPFIWGGHAGLTA